MLRKIYQWYFNVWDGLLSVLALFILTLAVVVLFVVGVDKGCAEMRKRDAEHACQTYLKCTVIECSNNSNLCVAHMKNDPTKFVYISCKRGQCWASPIVN
jgi:hypothetical protein